MSFYEAAKNFSQDLDRLAEDTFFKREELAKCPECGESVEEGAVVISPLRNSCATFHCGECGSVVDKWAEEVLGQDQNKEVLACCTDCDMKHPAGEECPQEEKDISDKLLDRKQTFIEDKELSEEQEEAIEDFVTWLTFRIDYGGYEL